MTTVRGARALLHRFAGKLAPDGDSPRAMMSMMGRAEEVLAVGFLICSDIEGQLDRRDGEHRSAYCGLHESWRGGFFRYFFSITLLLPPPTRSTSSNTRT